MNYSVQNTKTIFCIKPHPSFLITAFHQILHRNNMHKTAFENVFIFQDVASNIRKLPCCLLAALFVSFRDHVHSQRSVNEFQTISGIEIYWQSNSVAWVSLSRVFPAYASEARAASSAAKEGFNYINGLMTERARREPACYLVISEHHRGSRRSQLANQLGNTRHEYSVLSLVFANTGADMIKNNNKV